MYECEKRRKISLSQIFSALQIWNKCALSEVLYALNGDYDARIIVLYAQREVLYAQFYVLYARIIVLYAQFAVMGFNFFKQGVIFSIQGGEIVNNDGIFTLFHQKH